MSRVLAAVALIAVALAAHRATAQDATPPPAECAVYLSEGDGVLRWTGEGDAVTEPVRVPAGRAVLTAETGADGWLTVDVHAWPDGGSLADAAYLPSGGTAQNVIDFPRAGSYLLDVDGPAGAAWTVTIAPAR